MDYTGQIGGYYEDPAIQQGLANVNTTGTQASAYQSAAALLPQKLKQAIQEKLDYNKAEIEAKNKALSEYFMAPSQAREQYAGIFNPAQRESLVSRATQQAWLPYANASDILNQRMGSVSDMVSAGTGSFNAAVLAAQSEAEAANNNLANLMKMAQLKAGARESELTLGKPKEYAPKEPKSAIEQLIEDIMLESLTEGQGNNGTDLQEPPMSPARGGVKYEYPPNSGVIWVSNDQGGWD